MNPSVMPMRPLLGFALLATLASLSACQQAQPGAAAGNPPLEGAAIGGPFELVNSEGETVRWSDFDGQYRMVYFGYTWCPDVCPFDLQRMMQGYRQFAEQNPGLAENVQPIFITVDPERDTPDKIGEYIANFGDNLIGLTGSPEQIEQAAEAFLVYYERGPDDPNAGYLMQHTNIGYLMGPEGEPIATLPVTESAERVTAELEQWVS